MVDAKKWEWGEVYSVETHWHRKEDGLIHHHHIYRVVLERKVKNRYGEMVKCLILTVGDNRLQTTNGN